MVSHIEFVRLTGWIDLISMLLAGVYIYFNGNGEQESTRDAAYTKQIFMPGGTKLRIGESVCRLLILIAILWIYDIQMFESELQGKYLALAPMAVLFTIGFHLKTKKIEEWSKISLIIPTLGIFLILHKLWREANLTPAEATSRLSESILSSGFYIPVPMGIDFALFILFLSVLIPSINGSMLFGYKYGFLKYDIKIRTKNNEFIVLPLYSSFVFEIILAQLYLVLRFVAFRIIG